MSIEYPTPASFDRALKQAAKNADGDPGEAYRQALRDRFLCRVFADRNTNFILKGGSCLLARIPDARATRDIDFATSDHVSAACVLEEIKTAAAIDLGDWCRFVLTKSEEALDENGYSRLLKLRFATYIGSEEKDPILIDLSLDCTTTFPPERITPANRLAVDGIKTYDYMAYPLPDQLADKFCAIMELQPGGYPSSRMKDLVDVVFYLTNKRFESKQLRRAIESECAKRNMDMPKSFAAPSIWSSRFDGFAKNCGLVPEFTSFEGASQLAANFFNPVIEDALFDTSWDYLQLDWVINTNE
jgi:hypothetical protein